MKDEFKIRCPVMYFKQQLIKTSNKIIKEDKFGQVNNLEEILRWGLVMMLVIKR